MLDLSISYEVVQYVAAMLIGAVVFTQAGEELLTDIVGKTVSVPTDWYGGWGTGAGTAAKGDTTLFTEAAEARVVATLSQPSADINQFLFEITAAGTKTITNAGVLSASSGGTLFIHGDHSGIALDASDSIEYTVTIEWT